jgi:predicted branched-subunit amino acid permease
MLIGVIPFGLVAGAAPVTGGLGIAAAVGFSTVVFAGASQLAAIGILSDGGSAAVAVLAACTINLRMLLYSASLAPYLAREGRARRLLVAYLLTDQAYAVSIARWSGEGLRADAVLRDDTAAVARRRFWFYLGAGLTLWGSWQASTVVGALIGNAVPDDIPLGFAVPLVFLVLLVPTVTGRPSVVAAVVGGGTAVAAGALGAGPLAVMIGAVCGIAAGALADRPGSAGATGGAP